MRPLINIFLLVAMVQVGMAVKCFNCDSSSNEGCESMTDINWIAEECTEENLKILNDGHRNDIKDIRKHWLLKISTVLYFKTNNDFKMPMACQKITGIDENQRRTTVRRCQYRDVMPCNFTKQFLGNREIEHCSLCEEDGCNSSSNNQVFGMMIGVVVTITIYMHLIL